MIILSKIYDPVSQGLALWAREADTGYDPVVLYW